jgi:hypothetical protein
MYDVNAAPVTIDRGSLDTILDAAENYLLYLKRIKPLKNVRIDGVVFDLITPEELGEYTGEIETAIMTGDTILNN